MPVTQPPRPLRRRPFLILGIVLLLILIGYGISKRFGGKPADQQGGAVPVSVETVQKRTMRIWSEFSGRLHAVDSAEIRPEVSGKISEVRFEDGQSVKAGDILFVIDPQPYEAAVARAEANLAAAQANEAFAKKDLFRAAKLVKSRTIPRREFDERTNASHVATSSIKSAEAELKQARIDLDHAYVKAPIGGRVSRAEITVGNLVESGPNAPLLTTVVSSDSIYADFEVDEQTYLQSIRSHASTKESEKNIPVELMLKSDRSHVYRGTIYTFDNRIDSGSGTIRARAKFENQDGSLVPGMFVTVRLASSRENEVILVPERAIGTDQDKKYVYVVGEENKVVYREVKLGADMEGERVVLNGLSPGDKVIVDGTQHVRPDAVVEPKEVAQEGEEQPKEAKQSDSE